MTPLKIKLLAHKGAEEELFDQGKELVNTLIAADKIEFDDSDPDVLFFLTGGSERSALAGIEKGKFYVLVATSTGNSNASAMEVKAALRRMDITSILLDGEEDETRLYLEQLHQVKNALVSVSNQQLGLIGEVSEWLVASEIKPEILNSTLGIRLKKVAWESLPDFKDLMAPENFLSTFSGGNPQDVEKAGQVFTLLQQTREKEKFDALTVECFSLVKNRGVSGCLALAKLNQEGIPTACEGDIVSAVGMILAKALTGQVPWMANVAKIGYEKCLLAHCTISPDLVSEFEIKTHYETGIGTAIQGNYLSDKITVFRLDETVSRIFITEGTILDRPKYTSACRTQIEVKFPQNAVDSLRDDPLGNHHLILPGNHEDILLLASRILNLEPVIH